MSCKKKDKILLLFLTTVTPLQTYFAKSDLVQLCTMKKRVSNFKKVDLKRKLLEFLINTICLKKQMFPIKMFLIKVSLIADRVIFHFDFLILSFMGGKIPKCISLQKCTLGYITILNLLFLHNKNKTAQRNLQHYTKLQNKALNEQQRVVQ